MKKCPKCGIQYSDFDSYCMECGAKLVPIKPPVRKEFPAGELMSLLSQVGELETAVDRLQSTVDEIKHFELPKEVISTSVHAETLEKLVARAEDNTKALSEIGKRVRAEEAATKQNVTLLVQRVDKLEAGLASLATDIGQKISRTGKMLKTGEAATKASAASLMQRVSRLETALAGITKTQMPGNALAIKNNQQALRDIDRKVEKLVKTTTTFSGSLSKRLDARLDGLENEFSKLSESQQKLESLELEKITPQVSGETQGELSALRSQVSQLSGAVKKLEAKAHPPEAGTAPFRKDIDSMGKEFSRFVEEVKKNREGIRELMSQRGTKDLEKRMSGLERDISKKIDSAWKEISRGVSEVRDARNELKKANLESFLSELEGLKSKIQALERKQASLQSLYERLQRIEDRVSTYRESVPTIIE